MLFLEQLIKSEASQIDWPSWSPKGQLILIESQASNLEILIREVFGSLVSQIASILTLQDRNPVLSKEVLG